MSGEKGVKQGSGHKLFGVLERKGMVAEMLFLGRSQSQPPFGSGVKKRLPQLLDIWEKCAAWREASTQSCLNAMP